MMPSPDFLLLPLFYAWSGFAFCLAVAAVQYLFALNVHRRTNGQSSVPKVQAGVGRIVISVVGMGGMLGFARLFGFVRGKGLLGDFEPYCALALLAGGALGIYLVCQVHKWLPPSHNEG